MGARQHWSYVFGCLVFRASFCSLFVNFGNLQMLNDASSVREIQSENATGSYKRASTKNFRFLFNTRLPKKAQKATSCVLLT